MQYRAYGKTGLNVSALGFGAMRLPALDDGTCDYEQGVPLLRQGIDLGINYIDAAWGYINGTSEVAVGKAIKPYNRDELVISTKIPIGEIYGDTWRERLEIQLKRFDMDYIDIMHMHGLSVESFENNALGDNGCLKAARQAQSEGLIRHLAFSSHDTPENVVKLVQTGEFEGVTLQYNFLDQRMAEPIALAHEKGMGTVIMGPVGGGRMSMWNPGQFKEMIPASITSAADLAIRWVLSHDMVSVALSGMITAEMIQENVITASRELALSNDDLAAVQTLLGKLNEFSNLYCTGCGYCMPCPNGVDIPGNFILMNYYKVYGMHEYAQSRYASLEKGERVWLQGTTITGKPASACIQCGECEPKCPQNIRIIEQLEEVVATLS